MKSLRSRRWSGTAVPHGARCGAVSPRAGPRTSLARHPGNEEPPAKRAGLQFHDVKQPNTTCRICAGAGCAPLNNTSHFRGAWAPRFDPFAAAPNRGAAERRQGALDSNGRAGKTRQPRSRGVGAPCEGARASRRSAWRFLAQARFASPALPPDPSRVLRAAGSRARRAWSETSRAGDLCRRPGRHSRSVFRIVSGDAPRRAGWVNHRSYSFRSQQISTSRIRPPTAREPCLLPGKIRSTVA